MLEFSRLETMEHSPDDFVTMLRATRPWMAYLTPYNDEMPESEIQVEPIMQLTEDQRLEHARVPERVEEYTDVKEHDRHAHNERITKARQQLRFKKPIFATTKGSISNETRTDKSTRSHSPQPDQQQSNRTPPRQVRFVEHPEAPPSEDATEPELSQTAAQVDPARGADE